MTGILIEKKLTLPLETVLLIDKLTKIIHLKSATAIMNVKKGDLCSGTFSYQPVILGSYCRGFWSQQLL